MFADHEVKPGRLRICTGQSTKPRSKPVVRGEVELPASAFREVTTGTWSLAEVTLADARPPRCSIVAATARGVAAIEEDGEDQGAAISAGQAAVRRAISVPLTPVRPFSHGHSRIPGPQVRPCDRPR